MLASNILDHAGQQLGQSLPRLAGALILLLLGLAIAWAVGPLTRRLLSTGERSERGPAARAEGAARAAGLIA
jgi:hypothetical protein